MWRSVLSTVQWLKTRGFIDSRIVFDIFTSVKYSRLPLKKIYRKFTMVPMCRPLRSRTTVHISPVYKITSQPLDWSWNSWRLSSPLNLRFRCISLFRSTCGCHITNNAESTTLGNFTSTTCCRALTTCVLTERANITKRARIMVVMTILQRRLMRRNWKSLIHMVW